MTEPSAEPPAPLSMFSSDLEYATQFLEFSPQAFVDSMYNIASEEMMQFMRDIQEQIQKEFPGAMTEDELCKASQAIMKNIFKGLDRCFDNLETYLVTSLLYIPENITLPEDNIQEQNQFSQADEEKVDAEIEELKKKIHGALYMQASLKHEMEECNIVREQYEKYLSRLKKLENLCKDSGVLDLHENLVFVTENAIRLSKSVKSIAEEGTPPQQVSFDFEKFVFKKRDP